VPGDKVDGDCGEHQNSSSKTSVCFKKMTSLKHKCQEPSPSCRKPRGNSGWTQIQKRIWNKYNERRQPTRHIERKVKGKERELEIKSGSGARWCQRVSQKWHWKHLVM